MADMSNQGGITLGQGSNGVGQGNANQILQTLNAVAQALKAIAAAMPAATTGTGALPGSVVNSAGTASGKYIVVTAGGINYAVPLYNLS